LLKQVSQHLLALAALFVLTSAIYWRLTPASPQHVWFDQYDMCQLELPRLQFYAREWSEHRIPLWNPHTWGGQPAIGSMQPGPLYPLNVLFFQLPLRDGLVPIARWNWWFISIHILAAYFAFLLCRDLGLSRIASLLGGITFSCAGFLGSIAWIDIANGITWTPLIVMFVLRMLRGHRIARSSIGLGMALGISWLSGHHEIPLLNSYTALFTLLTVAIYRRMDKRLLVATVCSFALALSMCAVQMLPAIEFGLHSKRWVGTAEGAGWNDRVPYSIHQQYSLPWSGLKGFVTPSLTPENNTGAFVGYTICALAVYAFILCWPQRHLRYILLLAVVGLLFALGGNTPFHWLLYQTLPMLDKARTPVRCLYLVTFALSIAAAFGAHAIIGRRSTRWYQAMAGAVILSFALWEISVITARRVTPMGSSVCASALFEQQSFASVLRASHATGRIDVNRDQLMTNFGELHRFDQLQGFVPAALANVLRHELHTARTQELFGVTHHIDRTASPTDGVAVATNARGVQLFSKTNALPRAWVTHNVLPVESEGALRVAVQNPQIDLRETAIMLGSAPVVEQCTDSGPVIMSRPTTDRVVLNATLQCRGLVILSDPLYPGWAATIDGRPAPIVEAYGVFRAIVAEKGDHVIEMNYRPRAVYWGAAITIFGIAAAAAVLIRDRRHHA